MEVKHLIALLEVWCLLLAGARCLALPPKGIPPEEFFSMPEPELLDGSLTGPEKMATELFEIRRHELAEEGEGNEEKLFGPEVDEETIRKAEEMADKDLLNGLNRILKNNETLQDVFRTENIY